MKIKTKKSNILTGNIALLLAFLAPIFILICLFIAREIFPFGEEMYLRSDMYHQYAPFLKLFQTALKNVWKNSIKMKMKYLKEVFMEQNMR